MNILEKISIYNLPLDYIDQQEQILKNLRVEEVKNMINTYLNPETMTYVVVGNKKQLKEVKNIKDLPAPVVVDKRGEKKN